MIELRNVSKTYATGNTAVRNLQLTIQDGEFVFIVGKSGSGKSTLLKLLTRELEPTSGEIVVNDTPLVSMPQRYIPKYRRRLGIVFQDFRLLKDRSVYENVAFAQLVAGFSSREIRDNVAKVLRLTGLSGKYKYYPDQLSGGEQQRVAIARALVNQPEVLLADEPTGNLDWENSVEIMNLLKEINSRGTTVVVITHDRKLVKLMNRRVVTLERGHLISDECPETGEKTEYACVLPGEGDSREEPAQLEETQLEEARQREARQEESETAEDSCLTAETGEEAELEPEAETNRESENEAEAGPEPEADGAAEVSATEESAAEDALKGEDH